MMEIPYLTKSLLIFIYVSLDLSSAKLLLIMFDVIYVSALFLITSSSVCGILTALDSSLTTWGPLG